MKKLKGNIVRDHDINERMTQVFDYVGDAVANTYGPLGHTTLIQDVNGVTATKDGWTVLQNITLDNIFDNSIKKMIESCAFSVVLLVGDGTTTVTKVSSILNKMIRKYRIENPEITIRELETSLTKVVGAVIERLREDAIRIEDDNIKESIKNIALVSTNWDEELSEIISEIYDKTRNPIVKVETSGTTNTEFKIVDGYELACSMLIENFYITDVENRVCEIDNPRIMIFDHKILHKHFYAYYAIGQALAVKGQTLVLMAPDFDKSFIEEIKTLNVEASKNKIPYVNFIPVQTMANFAIDRDCINDFSVLVGAKVITRANDDALEFFDDVTKVVTTKLTPGEEHYEENVQFKEEVTKMIPEYVDGITGTCEKITIGQKNLFAVGMNNADEDLIDEIRKLLSNEISNKIKDCSANNYLTDDIRQKRIRLGKLQGKMGVISIGGFGEANLKARKDALDDATRACEAAFNDGYVTGSCIATSRAIRDTINRHDDINLTDLDIELLGMFFEAYNEVFNILFTNGEYSIDDVITTSSNDKECSEKIGNIFEKCLDTGYGFDILTKTYDTSKNKIINPVDVDIEVLKGCLRLLITSVTSNQFLFRNYEGFDVLEDSDSKEIITENPNVRVTNYTITKK